MKKHEKITIKEACVILCEAGQAVNGFTFSDIDAPGKGMDGSLSGVEFSPNRFINNTPFSWRYCWRVTEEMPLITEEVRRALKIAFPEANWMAKNLGDSSVFLYGRKPETFVTKVSAWRKAYGDFFYPRIPRPSGYFPLDWETSLVDLNEEIE